MSYHTTPIIQVFFDGRKKLYPSMAAATRETGMSVQMCLEGRVSIECLRRWGCRFYYADKERRERQMRLHKPRHRDRNNGRGRAVVAVWPDGARKRYRTIALMATENRIDPCVAAWALRQGLHNTPLNKWPFEVFYEEEYQHESE